MIRIKCPKCQKVLGIDDALAGTISSCDACGQKFKVPVPAKAKAAAGAPAKPAEPRKAWQQDDDFTPYAVVKPTGPERPPDDDRVDQMVKDSFRQKKRQKAWDTVGTPAKLMKAFALVGIGAALLLLAFLSGDCILYAFKLQQHIDNPGKANEYPLPRMFAFDVTDARPGEAPWGAIWAIGAGIIVVWLALEAITISGAESLRSLGSYKRALWGSIVGIFTTGPAGVLALMATIDEKVKLQFPEFKKELLKIEEREWEDLQEQMEEEREDREAAAREGRVYKPRRKRVEKQEKAEAQGGGALLFILGGLGFLVVACVIAYFVPGLSWAIMGIGWILSLWGGIQLLILAFREDAIQGILVLFVPFYGLYYIITRWEEAKGAFFLQLAGFVFYVAGVVMAVITGISMMAE